MSYMFLRVRIRQCQCLFSLGSTPLSKPMHTWQCSVERSIPLLSAVKRQPHGLRPFFSDDVEHSARPVMVLGPGEYEDQEADSTSTESCKKATDETLALWPLSSCTHSPVSLRQSRTVSQEADAISAESGEKTTDLTESLWPLSSCTYSPVSLRQSRTVQSSEALVTKKHKVVPSIKALAISQLHTVLIVIGNHPVGLSLVTNLEDVLAFEAAGIVGDCGSW
jgi:hypothetical protein